MRPALAAAATAFWLALLPAVPAHAAEPAMIMETAKGKTLADASGMTLYVFSRDMPGKSACTGPCAAAWPPLKAGMDAKPMGPWSVVTRDDGSTQWAYKGKPLYHFGKDMKPGDMSGDGALDGAWSMARP
ncbi:COG4315 family predicted lipoprotein [Xanthobacter sediminis]|uniref:COG4315 family predicted lipoprotein n=1 Tax=Xanthobacter sediminis TaxID=3119926 RepID=UPI0037276CE4